MSTAASLFTGALDAAFRQTLEQSQHYQNTKADLEADAEYASTVGKVAAFIGIGGITLAFLGLGYCAARREGAGGAMMCGAVPLAIVSYDCYQASENFRTQVEEDPAKLMVITRTNEPIPVNLVALRKCLLNKTLFFEPMMGFYIRRTIRSIDFD